MNLRLNTRTILALLFVLVSLTSAIYITFTTVNYLSFYPALGQVQFQLSSVAFNNSQTPSVAARVAVENPTDYSGFRVSQVTFRGFFQAASDGTLFQELPLFYPRFFQVSLGAHSRLVLGITIALESQQAAELQNFSISSQGHVTVNATITVVISTFLDPVTGGPIPFQEDQLVPLS